MRRPSVRAATPPGEGRGSVEGGGCVAGMKPLGKVPFEEGG